MSNTVRLAVYGTLKSSHSNHSLLGPQVELVAKGIRIPGMSMFNIGPFPAVVRDPEGPGVEVEIYDIPAGALRNIDLYEGFDLDMEERSLFTREAVELENGDKVLMYFYNHPVPAETPIIMTGRWEDRNA